VPRKGEHENLVGRKFGKLTVIEYIETDKRRNPIWLCKCECGGTTKTTTSHLKTGHTTSCGCLSKERISKVNYKNGLSASRLGRVYWNMYNRCYRENTKMYSNYGARGIKVCDEWLGENGFINFSEWAINNGYSERLTLDRIDNEKGYSPNNCRWVDTYVQANNKRNNLYVMVNGEIDTVSNMARKHNVNYWNLLHYAKGTRNMKYPHLEISAIGEKHGLSEI
jgi:hypothetical protein